METKRRTREDRVVGVLRGLAVGDALGAQVEFQERGTFAPVTDLGPSPVHHTPTGCWTDDTSMAVCLGESLIRQGGYDSFDVMDTYVRWMTEGHHSPTGECFDIGNQTRKALLAFVQNPGALLPEDNWAAGNGTIMRLAPAAIVSLNLDDAASKALFALTAADTHNNPTAIAATVVFGFLLRALLQGQEKEEALRSALAATGDCGDLAAVFSEARERPDRAGGFVLDTLKVAWWAFTTTDSFEDAVLSAVNLGEDADTNAAVAGQLAGAYYGDSSIPKRWREGIFDSEGLAQMALDLHKVAGGVLVSRS